VFGPEVPDLKIPMQSEFCMHGLSHRTQIGDLRLKKKKKKRGNKKGEQNVPTPRGEKYKGGEANSMGH